MMTDCRHKKVSILVPCYNEEDNVVPLYEAVSGMLKEHLKEYGYEILFIDNDSADHTRSLLREICAKDKKVKAVFNAKNFGQLRSPYYGLMQTTGDCAVCLCCDFQDPIDLIPEMVREWENGHKIVVMQKTRSEENRLMYFLRSCYYGTVKRFSDVEQIEHFTGFGLYDREFIEVLRRLNDPTPFLRGIVAELGYGIKIIKYTQLKRKAGRSKNSFFSLYDVAMLSITSYTKIGLRLAVFLGFITAVFSFFAGTAYLAAKLLFWDTFSAGMAPVLIGMFFLGAVILLFLGIMGEYVLSINQRLMNRPLVIEAERINFETDNETGGTG